jgi:hypothetical protein
MYIYNTSTTNTADFTINFSDVFGSFTCSYSSSVGPLSSVSYWLPNEPACLPSVWSGGASITSTQPIFAMARSHIESEITSYNDFSSGSTTMYIPMLFKNQFGGSYNSALYVQNMSSTDPANITVRFYDVYGNYSGLMTARINPSSAAGYWIPFREMLPSVWSGGAVITSDQPIIALGRPHIGNQVMAYNGFSAGATTINVPMVFKNKSGVGGVYATAIYVQNVDPSNTANLTLTFYHDNGTLTGSMTASLPSLASTGFWVPNREFLPDGWSGSVVVTSDRPVVALGRLHVNNEINTYNGSAGSASLYIPLLHKDAFNGSSYASAISLQNTQPFEANVDVTFFSKNGEPTCVYNNLVPPNGTLNFWLNNFACP